MPFFDQYKKIHCVGIGGIGVSGIAKFLLAKGKTVTGSDSQPSELIDQLKQRGIEVAIGHDAANLAADVDLVVYTEAAGVDNPERAEAARRELPQLGHFDFLGALSKEYKTICVTGTNGKSTTTAMTGLIFEQAGLDPTVFVGSLVPGWADGNVRVGQGEILIIEGDEYKQKMVKLFPETTVITNIEEDHLDVYRDLSHIVATFKELTQKTAGEVILNADDVNSRQLIDEAEATFAIHTSTADLRAINRATVAGKQTFSLMSGTQLVGELTLRLPGEFNVSNALAAISVALSYGVSFEDIRTALESFGGIWRRFELVGKFNGADVISDYGHHPSAIKATLQAAREFYPQQRIVLLFQPHQHSRTKELFDEFVSSFDAADEVVLAEIYTVAGRTENEGVSSLDLARAVQKHMLDTSQRTGNVTYAPDLGAAEQSLRDMIEDNDVIIVMGAGDVDSIARNLTK